MGLEILKAEILDGEKVKVEALTLSSDVAIAPATQIEQYSIEYSKSNRSKCKKCGKNIDKNSMRIAVKGTKSSWDGFYHLDCFSSVKSELDFNFRPEEYIFLNLEFLINQIRN